MFLTLLDLQEVRLDDGSMLVETSLGERIVKGLKRLQEIEDRRLMPCNELIARIEDMSPNGRLEIFRQDDGDICLSIVNKEGDSASIEFCVPGAGGGKSPETLQALSDLGIAMLKDNQNDPNRSYHNQPVIMMPEDNNNKQTTIPDRISLNAQSQVDYVVEAFPVMLDDGSYMMGIATEVGCVYVTKEQAKLFFNLT